MKLFLKLIEISMSTDLLCKTYNYDIELSSDLIHPGNPLSNCNTSGCLISSNVYILSNFFCPTVYNGAKHAEHLNF